MSGHVPLASPAELKRHVSAGFAAASEGYDASGSEFFQPVGKWLVDTVGVPRGAWVLDAGCGKGAVSLPAARAAGPDGHVTGIDLAAPMLQHARDRARRVGLANVTFREGDAEDPGRYPGWEPGSFDVILASNVLQFLPRPAEAAARWHALLTPGGRLGVAWTVAQDTAWAPVIAALDAHVPDGVPGFGAFMRRPPFHDPAAFQAMLDAAGYHGITTVTRELTMAYDSPDTWWATYRTQGPWALSWRHIPADRLHAATRDAFTALEPLRAADGSLTRTLTFALTCGYKRGAPLHSLPPISSSSGDS